MASSQFYSTHLNSKIDSIEKLACRNMRFLGGDLVNIELAQDTAYECIAKAIELYSQYTEHDTEFLLFDSSIYTPGVGIKMDNLFSATPELSSQYDPTDPNTVVGRDYDLNDWRRVVDVRNIEVGSNQGTGILFTMQYALVQQMGMMYFSGGLNKGFDMISFYGLSEFMELREKMLALRIFTRFDPNTQILRLFPEPTSESGNSGAGKSFGKYYGLVECSVEKRWSSMIREHFVQEYSLALMKIAVANVRGKFGSVQLFGGGSVEFQTLMNQGWEIKNKLEEQLLNGTGGFANGAPAAFIVQ